MDLQASKTVPGRYDQIQEICDFVTEGAARAGFAEDTIFRLQLATDEACTNVIEHAYGGESKGKLQISWRIRSGRFVIEIQDNGRAFDPDDIPLPTTLQEELSPEDLDPGELQVGGLGLYFMRELMDEVHFEFNQEGGNTLTMIKRLPS